MNLRDLWSRLANRRRHDDGSVVADRPDGSRVFLDAETVTYLESDAPTPNQQELDAMLSRARRARVTMSVARGDRVDRELLLMIRDPAEVASLGATLRISDEPYGHCMCYGDPHLAFLDERDAVLAEISLHHGRSMRWSAWRDDARLLDGREVLEWLASRGARVPLDEYEDERREEEAALAAWEEWHTATPPCLQPLLEPYRQLTGQVLFVPSPSSTTPARMDHAIAPAGMPADYFEAVTSAFDEEYPDPREQARVLFAWFGRGSGSWSGFPSYEQVAECLLLRLSSHDLIRGFDESDKAETVEGAARFFAGWAFNSYRRDELKRVPERLRRLMRDYAAHTPDPDKLNRVRAALG
jgi:hypothetical protein